jgi:flavin reductase (DIM6/NTAB) family NADH-FMN oxidoreductase RutF
MVDPDLFRSVLGRFASSVTVLSARDATGTDHGMTVSAFSSVSLDPPLVLVCVDRTASIYPTLLQAEHIGISVLNEHQESCSRRFAEKDADRFDDLEIQRGDHGVALLRDAHAHLEGRIVARHEAGDHTIFVASVERAAAFGGRPLLYYRGGYAQLER